MSYKRGNWYVYCDICGRRYLASETTKLSNYTGRGGLVVCNNDLDKIDYGLIPFTPRPEQNAKIVRVIHTDTTDGSPIFDLELDTVENISSYQYLETSQGTQEILVLSQDEDVWIATSQEL